MAADEPSPSDRLWRVADLARRWSVTPGSAWERVVSEGVPGLWVGPEASKPWMRCPKIGPRHFRFRPEVVLAWKEEQANGSGPGLRPLARRALLDMGWDGVERLRQRRGPAPAGRSARPAPAPIPPLRGPGPDLITFAEAAAGFSCPPASLLEWVKRGHLPVFAPLGRVMRGSEKGLVKDLWIFRADWEAFLRARRMRWGDPPAPPPAPGEAKGRFWAGIRGELADARRPAARRPLRPKVCRHVSPRPRPPGGKVPPFGWKVAPDTVTLLPVRPEQDVVGRMILLRGQGRNPRQMAAELTAPGCRRRDGKTSWGAGAVARILAEVGGDDGH